MEALCLSLPNDTDPSDSHSPTGAQSQFWRGTIQEELSHDHHDLDRVARSPSTRLCSRAKVKQH